MLAGGQHITLGYASPLFRVFGMFWGVGSELVGTFPLGLGGLGG